jgi:hypothetical protein
MTPVAEQIALCYLDALDAFDLETIAALWDEASGEPDLEHLLHELNEGLSLMEFPELTWDPGYACPREVLLRHVPGWVSPAPVEG